MINHERMALVVAFAIGAITIGVAASIGFSVWAPALAEVLV